MAESIAAAFATARRDARASSSTSPGRSTATSAQGTGERVRRRLAGRRVVVVSMLPVENLDTLAPDGEDLKRADYLVYTIRTQMFQLPVGQKLEAWFAV